MSDHHRSLDRALEVDPHNNWGVSPADFHRHLYAIPFKVPTPFVDAFPLPIDEEPVAYDGFGAPLYAHQVSPEGTE